MFFTKQKTGDSIKGFDWAGLGWQYLFFWYFSGVVHLIIILSVTSFLGIRAALIFSTLWLVPTLLFPRKTKVITACIGLILLPFSLLSLGYLFVYHQEFSQSVLFIIFESNSTEAAEYVSNYFSWWMIPCFLLYIAGAFYLWRRARPVYLSGNRRWIVSTLIIVALFGEPFYKHMLTNHLSFEDALVRLELRMEPAVPWQVVVGYLEYRRQLENMQVLLDENAKIAPLANLKDTYASQPSTLVLVIGESTDRQRMSLYGYPRATTPSLDAMRNELAVFTDVIGPRPYTIETLQQVLTFADQEHPDLYLTEPSILNIMKQAGYKTYWITNQQTMTKRNTMLTTFSRQTDEQYYLNNNRSQNARQYDDDVFAPFEEVLKQPAPRKFIVVHLLGTHMNYKYRYPKEYEKFADRQGVPTWVTGDQLPAYNSYDNAVLFNDYVVSGLIKKFSAIQPNGLLVYFSDHGEEVFDTPGLNFQGRLETKPLPTMYTIPFIIWASPKWKENHPGDWQAALARPYSTTDFIYTWTDLIGLSFDKFDPTKSLVNKGFKEHPRFIGDPYAKNGLVNFNLVIEKAEKQKALMAAQQK
jgi:heptose-I-phosphate ethanolaminephosphotransferase